MKFLKKLSIILLAATFCHVFPAAVLDAKTRPVDKLKFPPLKNIEKPVVEAGQTANGIQLRLIKNDKLPVVDFMVILKGGSLYDPKEQTGLSTITAELLRIGGAGDMKPEELDKALDADGISISIYSMGSSYRIEVSCLKEDFDKAMSYLAKILRQPTFNQDKLEEIKTKSAAAIARRNDEPSPISDREFSKLIYGDDSPFAILQEYEHLDQISQMAVAMNYKKFFAPGNMLTGLVGPLSLDEYKAVLEKHFGDWNAQAQIPALPTVNEPSRDFNIGFIQKENLTQSYLCIGHLGVVYNPAENAKIRVFNQIFSDGFAARLTNRVRIQMGLTYGISGGILPQFNYPGQTYYSTYTKCESTIKAVQAIKEEIERIRKEKVSEKELADAKESFFNSYVFEFNTPDRVLRTRLYREFNGVDINAADRLIEDVRKVTADDILQTAQKYLHPDKMMLVILSDKAKLDGDLAQLGKVKELDIAIPEPKVQEKIPEATPESLKKGLDTFNAIKNNQYKGYQKVKSFQFKATVKRDVMGNKMDMSVTAKVAYPDQFFAELGMMGMKIEMIAAGGKGVMKAMGQQKPLPAAQLDDLSSGDAWFIFNKTADYKFQYLKETEENGQKYDVLYVTDTKNKWQKLFINKKTGYIEMTEAMSVGPAGPALKRSVFSDFRIVNGIPFAFASKEWVKDKVDAESITSEVIINPSLSPDLFKFEEPKE